MLTSAEYCTLDLTWDCSQDPVYLLTYSVLQDATSDDWTSTIPEVPPSSPTLHCTTQDVKSPAELRCTCKQQHSVSISGIDVISESRIVEIYSDMNGYLSSYRGDLMPDASDADDEESVKLYNCRIRLRDPESSITLKFLGLGERRCFVIRRLHLALIQEKGPSTLGADTSSIDLTRVRGLLNSMGDAIPENAHSLLNSVEQYQQMMGMSAIQSMFSGSRSRSPEGQGARLGQLTGLLSMFSKIPPNGVTSRHTQNKVKNEASNGESFPPKSESGGDQGEINSNKNTVFKHEAPNGEPPEQNLQSESGGDQGESDSIKQTLTEQDSSLRIKPTGEKQDNKDSKGACSTSTLSPLDRLLRKPVTSAIGHDVRGQGDMFQMLQSICGSVSSMRISSQTQDDEETECHNNEREGKVEDPSLQDTPSGTPDTLDLHKVIRETVIQEVKNCEQRIKEHIDISLVAMETRINLKLDTVLNLLQNNENT